MMIPFKNHSVLASKAKTIPGSRPRQRSKVGYLRVQQLGPHSPHLQPPTPHLQSGIPSASFGPGAGCLGTLKSKGALPSPLDLQHTIMPIWPLG